MWHIERDSRFVVPLFQELQKGGVPAAPSGTATLLRLSPSYQFYPRQLLAVTDFRYPQLPWLDGRCVQGPGTYGNENVGISNDKGGEKPPHQKTKVSSAMLIS